MWNKIIYLLTGVALGFLVFTIIRISSGSRKTEKEEFESYFMFNLQNSTSFILPSHLKVQDSNGNHFLIDSVLCEDKLVVRFTELCCDKCIASEIKVLKEIFKKEISEKVVGIISCENVRLLRLIIKKYQINFPVYFLPYIESKVIFPEGLEALNAFYTFRGNVKLECSSIFIPSESFRGIAKSYYQGYYQEFCNHNPEVEINPFEQVILNFGTKKVGQEYIFEFPYTNKMQEPLILKNVKTTCGCTVAEWSKEPLYPGKSTVLKIKFKPESEGVYLKKVYVYFGESPYILAFKGIVE